MKKDERKQIEISSSNSSGLKTSSPQKSPRAQPQNVTNGSSVVSPRTSEQTAAASKIQNMYRRRSVLHSKMETSTPLKIKIDTQSLDGTPLSIHSYDGKYGHGTSYISPPSDSAELDAFKAGYSVTPKYSSPRSKMQPINEVDLSSSDLKYDFGGFTPQKSPNMRTPKSARFHMADGYNDTVAPIYHTFDLQAFVSHIQDIPTNRSKRCLMSVQDKFARQQCLVDTTQLIDELLEHSEDSYDFDKVNFRM